MTADMATVTELPAPVLYRVEDVVTILNLSRSVVYELIRSGRLKTVKEGRSRRVPALAVAEYVSLLMDEAGVVSNDQAA
ncbi:helix-turn-helix domain-containing protein [Kribbella sp. NPDC003505]|uniref:helix-turn-helix domain-containing protein n=1 Tax=Kribbella sp. NPDC003505 TaxID=3154448 RepID=UPI0033A7EDBF